MNGNTLIIGYGGYGCTCVKAYCKLYSIPVLLIDDHPFPLSDQIPFQECLELCEDDNLNESRVRNQMSGYSSILLVTSLGGGSIEVAHSLISKCASSLKLPLITLCLIPYSFESERRSRAFQNLDSLPVSLANMFVIDLQKTIVESALMENIDSFLNNTVTFVTQIVGILSGLLEKSPFFTFCSSPSYTISIGSGVVLKDAVLDALEHPLFDIDYIIGKVLICDDSEVNEFDREQAVCEIASRSNALPEFVGRSGLGVGKVLLFIPISFRRHE